MKRILSFIGALVIWQLGNFLYAQGPPNMPFQDNDPFVEMGRNQMNRIGLSASNLGRENSGAIMLKMTTAQRDVIADPEVGLLIFNLENQTTEVFNGVNWEISSSNLIEIEENPVPPTGNFWTKMNDLPSLPRGNTPVGFGIRDKGYMGLGYAWPGPSGALVDFWEFTPATNSWTQKANFPGIGRYSPVSFSIGSKGYVGTGTDPTVPGGTLHLNDFWEFDPLLNIWTKKKDVPGPPRENAVGFAIGDRGYVGTGTIGYYVFANDFWEYNPDLDEWIRKADFGGGGRTACFGFAINDKGYVGTGTTGYDNIFKDFWEYDPSVDKWNQKADFGGGIRKLAVGFSIGNRGYAGTGTPTTYGGENTDFWEYYPSKDFWVQKADFAGYGRRGACGFSIGEMGFIGLGSGGFSGPHYKDFWEYSVLPPIDSDGDGVDDIDDCAPGDPGNYRIDSLFIDSDNDGYDIGKTSICIGAEIPTGFKLLTLGPDCDDSNPELFQNLIVFLDGDNDGYDGGKVNLCFGIELPVGYKITTMGSDCNDNETNIHPNQTELLGDAIDNDCDGLIDEKDWFFDKDGDGFGNPNHKRASVSQPDHYVENSLDCKDFDATVYPGAPEICDGKDNDCNGLTDDGLSGTQTWYKDSDGDGFGNANVTKFGCSQPLGYVAIAGDCKDWDATVYEGAPELCDGKDNDCNGLKDDSAPGTQKWYKDSDGDGYGNPNVTKFGCSQPTGFISKAGDCKDWNAAVYPGNGCPPITGIVDSESNSTQPKVKVEVYPEIDIFPNPARGEVMVTLNGFEPGQKLEIQMIKADGKVVTALSLTPFTHSQQVRIDVRRLSAGYYLLQVKQGYLQKVKKVLIVR